jgi:branched-chain amino acid transport system substrate-binding protein
MKMEKHFLGKWAYGFVALIGIAAMFGGLPSTASAEVKIGVIYPFTGGSAAAGRELEIGARLAADIANRQMPDLAMDMAKHAGIQSLGGEKVRLLFRDHRGDPRRGADLAETLITSEKVHGLIGCYQSSVTRAVSEVCERHGIPMINGTSTSPALTQRGFQWFWRTTPNDKWFTRDLFLLLVGLTEGKVKGVRRVSKTEIETIASACESSEWGTHVSDLIRMMADEYGFRIGPSLQYSAKAKDLSDEADTLVQARPGVMLFASYTSDAILMMKALRARHADPKIIWGQDAGFEKIEFRGMLGYDIEGVLTRTVFHPKLAGAKKIVGQINALYKQKKRAGDDMGGAAARAFTAVQAWAHVLEKAGSTVPADIQRAANRIHIGGDQLIVPWYGIRFAAEGEEKGQNVLGSGLIGQYQKDPDGNLVMEIVYPFELATAKMIYPFKGF